jgi:hypothetical protein
VTAVMIVHLLPAIAATAKIVQTAPIVMSPLTMSRKEWKT